MRSSLTALNPAAKSQVRGPTVMRTDGGDEMTVRQRKLTMIRKSGGFDDRCAGRIVVLATGLLALAALQGADAQQRRLRARSQMRSHPGIIVACALPVTMRRPRQ
jgi:hypothetical protein